MEINDIKNEIIKYSILRSEAWEEGNVKKLNKCMYRLSDIHEELKKYGEKKVKVLYCELLKHENEYVRLYAAANLIPYLPIRSRIELFKLKKYQGYVGAYALSVLKYWSEYFKK